jgi:S1-C subfamily serine protease|uniref:PDZ domain-containing protein n=1 Tax=Calcidiscus leptoporus TaxID=127549 RepID=A0A7S0IP35_9EUKA|mmetsp:Transcript_15248/g.35065  ORF Transcript_15248/g.35065 Transcript_15248/m.35065 type:complete len:329 (+) Transcript_15248:74-1060(+)
METGSPPRSSSAPRTISSPPRTIKLTVFVDLHKEPSGEIRLGVGAGTQDGSRLNVVNMVKTVVPDSAAARGGLQPGDVVSTWDGEPLTSSFTLSSALALEAKVLDATTQPTKRVTLEVMRQINKPKEHEEAIKEQPDSKLVTVRLSLRSGHKSGLKLQGRQVIDVTADSLADKAGLRVGDVLHSWDGIPLGPQYTPQQAMDSRPEALSDWTAVLLVRREVTDDDDTASDTGSAISGLSGLSLGSNNWPSNLIKIQLKVPESKKLGLRVQGNTVVDVYEGAPAHVAGLRQGDVVQTWDEMPLTNSFTLRDAMETAKVGPHDPVLLVKRY